jgi:DNA polymerase-3 subunit delta'
VIRRFDQIVGQDRSVDILRRAIGSGRLHHANLLTGPEGVGKRTLAIVAAARLNCETPDGPEPCGHCRGCELVFDNTHPDLVFVEPDGRMIKVEQVREIISLMRFRPSEGGSRVVVIEHADQMREEAANALLKTLEEPNPQTIFFMLSSQPHRLLSTIRSRCQPLVMSALSVEHVLQVLAVQGHSADDVESVVAARASEGSVARAIELIESPWWQSRTELFARFIALLDGSDDAVTWADSLSKTKELVEPTLTLLRALLRDMMLVSSGAEAGRLVHEDVQGVRALASRLQTERVVRMLSWIEAAERELLGNVNARMVLEILFLKMARSASERTYA